MPFNAPLAVDSSLSANFKYFRFVKVKVLPVQEAKHN